MSSGVIPSSDCCCWQNCFKMKKSNFRLLLLLAFYGLFLILGAAIFSAIESPLEVAEVKNMRDRKNHFLRRHACVTGKSDIFATFIPSTGSARQSKPPIVSIRFHQMDLQLAIIFSIEMHFQSGSKQFVIFISRVR